MSTLTEIEEAAAALSPEDLEKLDAFLRELRGQAEEKHRQELYRRTGFHPFPRSGGPPVTLELVQQICQEEGI